MRLARFNTHRNNSVLRRGLHGWWDGVQTARQRERSIDDCLTLKDLHPARRSMCPPAPGRGRLVSRCNRFTRTRPTQRRRSADERDAQDGESAASYARWLGGSGRLQTGSADLRRGLYGVPARAGGSAGVLRRAGRHGRVRKDRRGRHAHRRRVRQDGADAPVRSGAPDANRLRDRDVFRASRGDGGDERVPAVGQLALDGPGVRGDGSAMCRVDPGHQSSARRRRIAAPGGAPRNRVDDAPRSRTVQLAAQYYLRAEGVR